MSPLHALKLLNKTSVSELAALSNLSKAYISQVKTGKRPPSERLLEALAQLEPKSAQARRDYYAQFMQSRQMTQCSPGTMRFYRVKLGRFLSEVNVDTATEQAVERFLLKFKNPGNRHAYFRAIRTFYRWGERSLGLPNPVEHMRAPKMGKLMMPTLGREQVMELLDKAENARDRAIIAMFTESGMRLSELANIKPEDIDWDNRTVRVIGKGNKEGHAPFGSLTEEYLSMWLEQRQPDGSVWGLNHWGITSMLRRLEEKTGLPCNPHTFRRTFACLLRKAGVDVMTIKDLGRWESLEMVQRYTRSVTFHDSLKLYKAPLS